MIPPNHVLSQAPPRITAQACILSDADQFAGDAGRRSRRRLADNIGLRNDFHQTLTASVRPQLRAIANINAVDANRRAETAPPSRRAAILACIHELPGINRSQLCAETGLGWGTIGYHLAVLLKQAHIRLFRSGNSLCAVPANLPIDSHALAATLASPLVRQLLAILLSNGALGPTQASRLVQVAPRVVKARFTVLHELGILLNDGHFHPRYHVHPECRDVLRAIVQPRHDALSAGTRPVLGLELA